MIPDTDERPRSNINRRDSMTIEHGERAAPGARDHSNSDLKSYFDFLFDNRWLIGVVTLIATLAGALYAFSTTPVYESNMTIHVEETSPNATKNILSEASSLFETKKPAIAEMELLRSRMVIAPAVDRLRLDIEVTPKYFPIARFWSAQADANELPDPGIFGHGGYVWGAERIDVSVFNVPAPMLNRAFVITAQGNNRYRLEDELKHRAWDGVVGTTIKAASGDGEIELRVEYLYAKPGAKFLLRRGSKQRVVTTIQNALNIVEQGKQSGVIQVTLQGESPTLVRNALNEIGREYLRQNLARKTEEAEKSLAFLNMQLPALKLEL
jgi:tyrosine-protein kinase Etk/Wzc